MDVHLDITDDRDVYVEEDNNMEVEKEVEKEVDEEVDKDVPIFVMHWYVSYWKQQKTQFVFHFQKDWLAIATLKPTFTFLGRDFAIFNTFTWQNPYQEKWKLVLE